MKAVTLAAGLVALAVPAAAAHATIGALPTAAPANQAAQSAVGMSIDLTTGKGFAVYRGVDKAVYMRTFYNAGKWSAQQSVGGVIIGAPSVATAAGNTVAVAARGTDNALWVRTRRNGTWGGWASWGGVLSSSPAVVSGSDGRIAVFVRGTDNALWTRTKKAGGSFTAWQSRGGRLTTAPAAVTISGNSFDVAAVGTDHAVWTTSGSSTSKTWRSIGGRTYSAPAIGYMQPANGGVMLVRGTDNALWSNVLAEAPTGWKKVGGTLVDAPTAAGTHQPDSYIIVAIRSNDQAVWTTTDPAPASWPSKWTRAWVPTSAE